MEKIIDKNSRIARKMFPAFTRQFLPVLNFSWKRRILRNLDIL